MEDRHVARLNLLAAPDSRRLLQCNFFAASPEIAFALHSHLRQHAQLALLAKLRTVLMCYLAGI